MTLPRRQRLYRSLPHLLLALVLALTGCSSNHFAIFGGTNGAASKTAYGPGTDWHISMNASGTQSPTNAK